ncbi:nicotinamide riboside transporter PnuC [Xanthovirga aplysinae]|uniref:nicotinamide riboside transporter PnuC n=1 Tax=Xanthovirga aplysinae TaxID=2529853 RepID=UPI0012BC40E3|nr:nicotinamide riboside transporter PnuC [Xanthovirga aplysinae]MTI31737.1 nicotinamide riboside transporter PnuC [Xanthovirga aplysinae]
MTFYEFLDGLVAGLHALSFLEIVAVICGVASVLFSRKNNILVYPTGIVNVLIYVYLCFQYKLYADMGINAYYFIMSVYGWFMWSRKDEQKQVLPISYNNKKENLTSILMGTVSFLILSFILTKFTDSDVPLWDATTTSFAFIGMYLMAKRKVENWIAWIITDIISVPLYYYKGLPLSAVQFFIFTFLAFSGYFAWQKEMRKKKTQIAQPLPR